MAYTSILFKEPETRVMKNAPVGFSWTILFFGPLPAFLRGDIKWGSIILILMLITFGVTNLIFMFIYNTLYIKDLIKSGYKAKSIAGGNINRVSEEIGMPIPEL